MQLNKHLKKVMKILIFAFLCTEMQTTYTSRDLLQQQGVGQLTESGNKGVEPAVFAPYQASIRLWSEEQNYFGKGHICSGALVAPSVVLTVGTCVHNFKRQTSYHPSELRVLLGSTQRFAPSAHSLLLGITHIYRDSDMAILMLERDVPQQLTNVQPIALPQKIVTANELNKCQLTSWGMDSAGHELHHMTTLKPARITIERPKYHVTFNCFNCPTLLYKDAGAPLINAKYLLGLYSDKDHFIDVSQHLDWIQQHIGDGSNQNSAIWGIMGFLVFTAYVAKCSCKSCFV